MVLDASKVSSSYWFKIKCVNRSRADISLSVEFLSKAHLRLNPRPDLKVPSQETLDYGLKLDGTAEIKCRLNDSTQFETEFVIKPGMEFCDILVTDEGAPKIIWPSERTGPGTEGGINRIQVGCGPKNL